MAALSGDDPFSPDYRTARERFLAAATRAGGSVTSVPMTPAGPHGEPLSIDVATIGPAATAGAVIVSSGLHGVEGYVGSAVQLALLQRVAASTVPRSTRLVLVHALNPFGFACGRRWNERNVDLNRNFLAGRAFLHEPSYEVSRATYDRLSGFLNPSSPPGRWEPYRLKAAAWVLKEGLPALQRTLPVGQYHDRDGLFYGGDGPEATTSIVRAQLATWIGGARLAVHLDVHSGLGAWQQCALLIPDVSGSPRADWMTREFGDRVRPADGDVAYRAHGTMTEDLRERAMPCTYHGVTMELGTYSGVRVLGALRAERRAHRYAAPGSPAYVRAKEDLVEVFAPRAPAWRREVVHTALSIVERAIDACGGID